MNPSALRKSLPALLTALALLAAAALHLYWLGGGQWGLAAASPLTDGGPVLEVTARPPFFALILLLVMGAYVMLCQAGLLPKVLLPNFYRWSAWAMAGVLLFRAMGDFHGVGLFKDVWDTPFAWYDTWVTTPSCLVLALASLAVALQDRAQKPDQGTGAPGASSGNDHGDP